MGRHRGVACAELALNKDDRREGPRCPQLSPLQGPSPGKEHPLLVLRAPAVPGPSHSPAEVRRL